MTSSNESRLDNKETKQEIEFSNDDDGDDVLKCSPVSHLWKDGNDCTPLVRPRDAKSTGMFEVIMPYPISHYGTWLFQTCGHGR